MAVDAKTKKDSKSGFDTLGVVLGVGAAVLFLYAISLFLQGGYMQVMETEKAYKIDDAPPLEAVTLALAEQQDKLDQGYRWVDKENGVVGLPLERAKELLIQKLNAPAPAENSQ